MAAVTLFHGLLGMMTTQMASHVATAVDPRIGVSGHGMAFSMKASAHAPATSKTRPRSSKSCALTSSERWSAASPIPARTRNRALRRNSGFCCAAAISGCSPGCNTATPTTVTAVTMASMPMRCAPCFATASAIRTWVCEPLRQTRAGRISGRCRRARGSRVRAPESVCVVDCMAISGRSRPPPVRSGHAVGTP